MPGKEFLRQKFQLWYSDKVFEQFEDDLEIAEITPINLSMPHFEGIRSKMA